MTNFIESLLTVIYDFTHLLIHYSTALASTDKGFSMHHFSRTKIVKLILATLLLIVTSNVNAAENELKNFAYVEVNDHALVNAGCYIRTDTQKPFFDVVAIFAANINGSSPNAAKLYFNPQVDHLLNHSDQVKRLQKQGIKVVLTILGNHENAGWRCFSEQSGIDKFADQVVRALNKYHLDGVDIDDEYSNCRGNNTSLIRISQSIKNHPDFGKKILSKALFADVYYFSETYEGNKLADFLNEGAEMTYYNRNYADRISPYLAYGMKKSKLSLGISLHDRAIDSNAIDFVKRNQYRGIMFYDVSAFNKKFLDDAARLEFGTHISALPDCFE